ncbi:YezD family protein [Prosthecochloris sp. N3]|uniref:YezD family protein n=1 Tax=Prosthecochloris ethylica TaxID=2743976 RepID=A0ABR9XQH1_9CHLB|nr:YezD family protein [Prosthecochloris ethylica]MBF0586457.1 YezD family protein [Prosthecochloris ethylica]MBF0636070.1 YezD family protein [Prosthecochloris ethylica]NUK47793.1 YezD family protein [Prosthecochloris ethylica]
MAEKTQYDDVLDEILHGLDRIAFGEILITIHDSRVVQVEHREKKRFLQSRTGDCAGRAQHDHDAVDDRTAGERRK